MDKLNEDILRKLIANCTVPIVLRGFVKSWPQSQWDIQKWCSIFGEREIPFRCMRKNFSSDEPCWERKCVVKNMTFKNFVDNLPNEQWMYFDYKYIHQWFNNDTELCKDFSWEKFGFSEKGVADTTLWAGSQGAHTPAHQDTYGVNIVAQLVGKKRWILFPAETGGMQPTRVPYEESSVYSQLNFYCPINLEKFKGLGGCQMVELCAGDALLVPRGWWHYVQNIDPVNITFNIWLPHEKDCTAQVSEALIKILVAQICKDLPQETAHLIVNPNEDDLSDTPLTVLFLQLETVAKAYLDKKRKARRIKRQRTREGDEEATADDQQINVDVLLANKDNNMEIAKSISSEELIAVIKENIAMFVTRTEIDEDESDCVTSNLGLTKAVIDAFSQSNVIDVMKQNLFLQLS